MEHDCLANSHNLTLHIFLLKGWENVLFELGSERPTAAQYTTKNPDYGPILACSWAMWEMDCCLPGLFRTTHLSSALHQILSLVLLLCQRTTFSAEPGKSTEDLIRIARELGHGTCSAGSAQQKPKNKSLQLRVWQNHCPFAQGKWVLVQGKQIFLATCLPGN